MDTSQQKTTIIWWSFFYWLGWFGHARQKARRLLRNAHRPSLREWFKSNSNSGQQKKDHLTMIFFVGWAECFFSLHSLQLQPFEHPLLFGNNVPDLLTFLTLHFSFQIFLQIFDSDLPCIHHTCSFLFV